MEIKHRSSDRAHQPTTTYIHFIVTYPSLFYFATLANTVVLSTTGVGWSKVQQFAPDACIATFSPHRFAVNGPSIQIARNACAAVFHNRGSTAMMNRTREHF